MEKNNNINFIKWASRVIAIMIFLVLIRYWKNIFLLKDALFQENIEFGLRVFFVLLSLGFLALNLIAATGLYLLKKWSYVLASVSIVFSTIFLGTSYFPFYNISILALINSGFLKTYLFVFLIFLNNAAVVVYLYRLRNMI